MRHLFTGFLLCIVVTGCETIIDLDVADNYESRLVVISTFSPGKIWTLELSQSVPFNDSSLYTDAIVSNATVVILADDGFRDTLKYNANQKIYISVDGNTPQHGKTYHLQIKAPGFADIEASSQVPLLSSNLLDVGREPIKIGSLVIPDQFVARFNIDDEPGRNYYRVTLERLVSECFSFDTTGSDIVNPDTLYSERNYFQSNSPLFHSFPETVDDPSYPDLQDSYSTAYFSDKLFDGMTREFSITFTPEISRATESIGNHFFLEVSLLSNDLFAHERTVGLHDELVDLPNINQRNPVVIHSNIQNGFGVFAAYTSAIFMFDEDGNEWQPVGLGAKSGVIVNCDNY